MTLTTILSKEQDVFFLHKALEVAKLRRGFCSPNPSVGAIIVGSNNKILADGYHFEAGKEHAEVDAIQKLKQPIADATLYVTLEPCCHTGKTPPCTDAIMQSGIKRVVYGYVDPNPIVTNKSATLLQNAGIDCEYLTIPAIDNFYTSYTHWQRTKRPFVTAKLAMTLDAKIAEANGTPVAITGEELRLYTHEQRKASDAILTTINTILADDPQLNVRIAPNDTVKKPVYILDTHLRFPLNAQIIETASKLTVFHGPSTPSKIKYLTNLNINCIQVPVTADGLDLNKVLEHIGDLGVHDLWVEAGAKCFTNFINQGLANKALIYIALKTLGSGLPAFPVPITNNFHTISWQQIGKDGVCELKYVTN